MSGRFPTIVTLASALLQLSNAKPADPTITTPAVLPRQKNSDTFIGFFENNNTWSSLDCNSGLTWFQSGSYAQCCPTTLAHCYAATACISGSQIYTYPDISSVSTIACTKNYGNPALSICNTIFIYENSQDSSPQTNINCGDSNANWSYYRALPSDATATTASISGAISSAPVVPGETLVPKSSSKAWIAGAVVGPVVGIALVGVGVWLLLRRRKKAAQLPQHGSASMAPIDPNQPPAGVGGFTDAKPQFHPAQPTNYDRPGQPDLYPQQGYPQQGGYSPAPQYDFQPADRQTGTNTHNSKYDGVGGTAELSGADNGSLPGSPPAAGPVSELSGVGMKQPEEGTSQGDKPK